MCSNSIFLSCRNSKKLTNNLLKDDDWWHRCNKTAIRITEYTLKGLEDGGEYHLQVLACNAGGVGEPAEVKEPIIVQDQTGPPEFLVNDEVRCIF